MRICCRTSFVSNGLLQHSPCSHSVVMLPLTCRGAWAGQGRQEDNPEASAVHKRAESRIKDTRTAVYADSWQLEDPITASCPSQGVSSQGDGPSLQGTAERGCLATAQPVPLGGMQGIIFQRHPSSCFTSMRVTQHPSSQPRTLHNFRKGHTGYQLPDQLSYWSGWGCPLAFHAHPEDQNWGRQSGPEGSRR